MFVSRSFVAGLRVAEHATADSRRWMTALVVARYSADTPRGLPQPVGAS